jgi:hypothetical protein
MAAYGNQGCHSALLAQTVFITPTVFANSFLAHALFQI